MNLRVLCCGALVLGGCRAPAREAKHAEVRDTAAQMVLLPVDTSSTPQGALRRYFAAIQRKDYKTAWDLWEDRGAESRPTLEQFAAGFTRTQRLRPLIGDSVKLEGAAGSQFATVPVVIDAVLDEGEEQHYVGSYTLRRAMVDGATVEQRQWHLFSAEMRQR
jgi:hypothetical protein